MNAETQLKVQALVDGELPPNEAAQVEALLVGDAGARQLAASLKATRDALRDNEPQLAVPESREFYWSKIAREIERLETQPAQPVPTPWLRWVRRRWAAWRRWRACWQCFRPAGRPHSRPIPPA
jgi:anti-sigma factor RsiW